METGKGGREGGRDGVQCSGVRGLYFGKGSRGSAFSLKNLGFMVGVHVGLQFWPFGFRVEAFGFRV